MRFSFPRKIPKNLKTKIHEWIKRYGPAELIGTATAYIGSFLTYSLTDNKIIAAYGATIGENAGFYGMMILREAKKDYRLAKQNSGKYTVMDSLRTARNLVFEFGTAEMIDSAIVRPAAIGTGTYLFGMKSGVIIGKIAADVSFYLVTIIAYEARKHYTKTR